MSIGLVVVSKVLWDWEYFVGDEFGYGGMEEGG